MSASNIANDLLNSLGGVDSNDLNFVLKTNNDTDDFVDTYNQSDYYDLDSLGKKLQKNEQKFHCISLNIESLNSKFNQLNAFLESLFVQKCQIDALILQETWLSDKQCEEDALKIFDIPGYKAIALGRKCGRKGGLMIYLRDCYTYQARDIYVHSTHWEGLFIDVTQKHNTKLPNKITLANIYRPPRGNNSNSSIDNFLVPFSKILSTLTRENSTLITGGDFNINLLQLNEREKFQEYFDLFVSNGSIPQITMPTRFSRKTATLIDQIFCRFSKSSSNNSSGIIVTKISDHLPCFSAINYTNNIQVKTKYVKVRKGGSEAIKNFQNEVQSKLSLMHFDNNLFADPNLNYSKLDSIINESRIKCFPVVEKKFNKYEHKISPWVTAGILKSLKFRDKLYVKWKKNNPSSEQYTLLENSYKSYCRLLQKTIRLAKAQYHHTQFENFKSDIKKTWKHINEILSKNKKTSDLPKYLFDGNRTLTENKAMANCFNNFFCNIGPTLANSITNPTNKAYTDYMKHNITSSFVFDTVTPDHVSKIIRKLKSKSSFGHDGLSSIQLKYISNAVITVLTHIINQSLCTGIFPETLKIAKISPIFKKGDPHITDNYRPISLLPIISKVFEKVVFIQLYDYLVKNKLLYDSQYGFRKFHSTELAALEFSDKIMLNLDEGKTPIAIFLDLSKAFDTIDHSILINKLKYYGVRGMSLFWFKSYLSNRKQFVQYNDSASSFSSISTGVPQGSILGPLLFIIYMNDIATVTNKFHFTLYADDTSLIEPICTFTTGTNKNSETSDAINTELNLITDWLCLNKLSLNAKKTKMMIFHHRQKNISKIDLQLFINNTRIDQVKEFDFLGITIDECMTWNSHVNKISGKISRVNGVLSRLKRFVPSNTLKMI